MDCRTPAGQAAPEPRPASAPQYAIAHAPGRTGRSCQWRCPFSLPARDVFWSYGGLRGVYERPFPALGLRVEHAFNAWVVVVGCGPVHSRQFVLPSSLIEPRHGLGNILRAFLALT